MFEARDGKEALVVFEEEEVDLVILDIMLRTRWMVCLPKNSKDVRGAYYYADGARR